VQALYGGGPAIPKDGNFPVLNFINKRVEIPPNGMKNPLNLCFMISGLQMLFSIEQINYHFAKKYS
jgi:ubiquitin C-terminal hydrolase